jgi:hypothetical protein
MVNKLLNNAHEPPTPPAVKGKYSLSRLSKRQYIFDLNNEYILPDDRTGTRQFMRHIDGDIETFIKRCKFLKNTNIVIEDATGFLRGKQSAEFSRLLVGKMHTGNNYIILFHSLNRVPPELMEMANTLILFKTIDNLKTVETKFKNENLTKGFLKLQSAPKYTNLIINLI